MAKCKQCGAKVSLWTGRGDGLCGTCGPVADEQAKVEAERAEAELDVKINALAEEDVANILRLVTSDTPVAHLFFYRDIEARKESLLTKVPGMALGAMLGGAGGEMLFGGTMLKDRAITHVAKVGVLVLTQSEAHVAWTQAPVLNEHGKICEEHLTLIQQKLVARSIERMTFDLSRTRMQASTDNSHLVLTSGEQNFYLRSASLSVRKKHWTQPSQTRIMDLARQQGGMLSENEIFQMIRKGDATLAESEIQRIKADAKMVNGLYKMIELDKSRDAMAANLDRHPWMRQLLGDEFQKSAAGISVQRTKILVGWLIAIGSFVTAAMDEDVQVFFIVVGCIAVIFALVCLIHLGNAKWARRVVEGWWRQTPVQ